MKLAQCGKKPLMIATVVLVPISIPLLLTHPLVGIIPLLLLGFFVYFFRDPEREGKRGEDILICPADGRVLDVEDGSISIFMGLLDVHVNRAPCSGVIVDIKRGGRGHFPAFLKDIHNE